MKMYVRTGNRGTLNLREHASSISNVLIRIPYGTPLEVEKVDNTWSYTSYNGQKGYVMNQFLSEAPAEKNDKEALKDIYTSLKNTLNLIEEALK